MHHFSRQDVTQCPAPTASVIAGNSTLILATESQTLEVRDLKDSAKMSHSFQTIDKVCQLLYAPVGNCLFTLEGKRGEKGSSVRAYMNWYDRKVDNAPIRPRIASRVTPSVGNAEQGASLDMIEFPQRDSPLQIAVCPATGNLLVGAANLLIIYRQTFRIHEATKAKYVDFQECFHIFHTFLPKELSLVEDVVGCLSDSEVHVFKIKITDSSSQDEKSLRSISLYSFTSDSDGSGGQSSMNVDPFAGSVRRNSSEEDSSSVLSEKESGATSTPVASSLAARFLPAAIKNITMRRQQDSESPETPMEGYVGNVKRHPNHFILGQQSPEMKIVHLPGIEETQKDVVSVVGTPRIMEQSLGPSAPPVHRPTAVKCLMSNGGEFEAECVVLVHCKLLKTEEGHEAFKNLNIKPVYWREFRVKRSGGGSATPQHPLQSKEHMHLMSLTTCFTSATEGYLFHVPGHIRKAGKGCGVQRIATYPFTSPVGRTALEPTLMHALTDTGLETYTLRSGYHTVLEAENLNGRTNACPGDSDNPICLVGLRPFLGAKHLMVSGTHLVILADAEVNGKSGGSSVESNNGSSSSKWTLYALSLPSQIDLHRDMMQLANMNKTISPQGYYQLLCEAHMVLRTSFHQLIWKQPQTKNKAKIEQELRETIDKYQETCLELAFHHVLTLEAKDYKLALPYFRMSGKPISNILVAAKEQWFKSERFIGDQLPPGLLYYIQEVVLKPTAAENTLDANLADEIIDLLGKYSLGTLAELILKSPGFREFKTNKMFQHFRTCLVDKHHPEAEEVLAFAVLSVQTGSTEEISHILRKKMSGGDGNVSLSALLIEYNSALLELSEQGDSFSELALLLRDCLPEMFVEVLVSLIKGNVFSLSLILQLFIGSFVSMSNITGEAAQNAAMLQLFLETYFTEFLNDNPADNDDDVRRLDQEQEQALQTLVRSYLTSLSVPVRFGDRDIDTDMFGTRQSYLDKLPPFEGQTNAKESLEDADSPDFWCQNSLLKLQSLLSCSSQLGVSSCYNTVSGYLDMYPDVVGVLSLRVLTLDPAAAIPLLCASHPGVLLLYAKEQKNLTQDHWHLVLTCLHEHLTGSSDDLNDLMHEAWYSAMQEVLDHLAQTLNLDAFLQVLPGPHSNEDFQGYIQMCRKNQQAADIQSLIVNTGHKLLSTLTL